jgi:SOS-response transcriptional repressor LexA
MQKSYYAIIPADVRYDNDLSPNAKLLYGEITALCNEKGYCWAGNAYFSELYKVTNRSISNWINSLEQKGYIKRTIIRSGENKQVEQRIIHINNGKNLHDPIEENFLPYGKNLHDPIEENFRKNNTFINNTTNNTCDKKKSPPKVSDTDYSSEFAKFWEVYPKKVDKKRALEAYVKYRKTSKNQVPITSIVQAVQKYASSVKEKRYYKNPTTYINGENWNDEIEETNQPKINIGTHQKANGIEDLL